jgi:transcriptional regulator with XRE-family HTH domain
VGNDDGFRGEVGAGRAGGGGPPPAFTRRLRELREAAGLSQSECARRIGVTRQYLRLLERGDKRDPGWRVVCALADTLGVSTEEFRRG